MHAFHLPDDERTSKIWAFLQASTITRNLPAYRLWTSPKSYSGEGVEALLNQHAYEFMTGYDFEGFNSHYNYLSAAGQSLKEIAVNKSSRETDATSDHSSLTYSSTQETQTSIKNIDNPVGHSSPLNASPSSNTMGSSSLQRIHTHEESSSDQKIQVPHDTQMMDDLESLRVRLMRQLSAASLMMHKLKNDPRALHGIPQVRTTTSDRQAQNNAGILAGDIITLNRRLDDQLDVAKRMSKTLDDFAKFREGLTDQVSLQKQFDQHLEAVQHTTKMIKSMQQNRQTSITIPIPETEQMAISDAVIHSDGVSKSTIETIQHAPEQSEHLTEQGKRASQEAGAKLRERLYGIPKAHDGATNDDIHRWVAYSRDSTSSNKAGMAVLEPTVGLNSQDLLSSITKKKSVRFSFPASSQAQTYIDGAVSLEPLEVGPSKIPGETVLEEQMTINDLHTNRNSHDRPLFEPITIKLPDTNINANNKTKETKKQEVAAAQNPKSSNQFVQLSSTDILKVQELIGAFDSHGGSSLNSIAQLYKENIAAKGLVSPPKIGNYPSGIKYSEITDQVRDDAKTDTPETCFTKLWCQAVESIIGNIKTFANQLEHHVQPQIDREQAALDQKLRQHDRSCSPENDKTFFKDVHNVKDLINLRGLIQQTANDLHSWTSSTEKLLEEPGMVSGHNINIHRLEKIIECVMDLGGAVWEPLESFSNSFVPSSSSSPNDSRDSWQTSSGVAEDAMWMPRRFGNPPTISEKSGSSSQTNNPGFSVNFGIDSDQNRYLQYSGTYPSTSASHGFEPFSHSTPSLECFPSLIPSTPNTGSITNVEAQPGCSKVPFTYQIHPSLKASAKGLVTTQASSTSGPLPTARNPIMIPPSWPPLQDAAWNPFQTQARDFSITQNSYAVAPQSGYPLPTGLRSTPPALDYSNRRPVNPPEHGYETDIADDMSNSSISDFYRPQQRTHMNNFPAVTSHINPFYPAHSRVDAMNTRGGFGSCCEGAPLHTEATVFGSDLPSICSSNKNNVTEPNSSGLFELFEDIPDHADPGTADAIGNCVESLKSMGYGSILKGGKARLVVYAQAAKGELDVALDIIEEERKVYRDQEDLALN